MAFSPLFLIDCEFEVGGTDYAGELSSIRFVTNSSQQEFRGLTPDAVYTASTTPTYVAEVGYAQDWETAGSFSNLLYDQAGETVAVTFKPKGSGTVSWTANLLLVPGDIGGDTNTFAESSVTLGSDKPVKVVTP